MGAIQVKAMCIVLRSGREVLVSSEHDPATGESFGRLFGGGVEFGELAEDALRREFQEELDSTLENVQFLRVWRISSPITARGDTRLCSCSVAISATVGSMT